MSNIQLGSLVVSVDEKEFDGVGKVVAWEGEERGTVGFWLSPSEPEGAQITAQRAGLKCFDLYEEQVIFVLDSETGYWRRARYGGPWPDGRHLAIFRRDTQIVVGLDEIYVCNAANAKGLDPIEFLKNRCNDSPYFTQYRLPFIGSYIKQRAACRSMSALLSSSIELQPHQLAVVRRVLQDQTKRYLLADEVGLGKTVEAGLILREELLKEALDACAVIAVPDPLIAQWTDELTERFHLGDLLDRRLFVVSHQAMSEALAEIAPRILVIDEAHIVSKWAWSSHEESKNAYFQTVDFARGLNTLLLLSGTPLIGNEKNYLAMLHILSPDRHAVDEAGVERFRERILERERVGGIHLALDEKNDNASLTEILEKLEQMFPKDGELIFLIEALRPHVDFLSDANGPERSIFIKKLRDHIGESYKLHRRMLRNRRDDQAISLLFPGLAGGAVKKFHVRGAPYSIEQHLEDFRATEMVQNQGTTVTRDSFLEWLELALVSPMVIAQRAKQALNEKRQVLSNAEARLLRVIAELGILEQEAKDQLLLEHIQPIIGHERKAKVVVFCTLPMVADHVAEVLLAQYGNLVERHSGNSIPKFCHSQRVKILVCDERGEDGLNLHGGQKIIIHYSLPRSLPRIEQRIGRVNRYSANLRGVRQVESILFTSGPGGYGSMWANILVNTIKVFNQSTASLQFVLEDRIDRAWSELIDIGWEALTELDSDLAGSNGLIQVEKQRVRVQEELNRMDDDIRVAEEFSESLCEEDDRAETHIRMMMDWIAKALQFGRVPIGEEGIFRFKYVFSPDRGSRTLLDLWTFIRRCQTGIDKSTLSNSSVQTAPMSAHRGVTSDGNGVYPLRYGQPFVDVIFQMLEEDPRGICSAHFRMVRGYKTSEPTPFLQISWIVQAQNIWLEVPSIRRKLDESFPPRVLDFWFDNKGEVVEDPALLRALSHPYRQEPTQTGGYVDLNIRAERWSLESIEAYFPKKDWSRLITRMSEGALDRAKQSFSSMEKDQEWDTSFRPICARFIALTEWPQ